MQTIPNIEENTKPSVEDTILPIKSPDENNPEPEHNSLSSLTEALPDSENSHVDTDTETDENQNCSGAQNVNCNNGACTITCSSSNNNNNNNNNNGRQKVCTVHSVFGYKTVFHFE